MATSSVKGLLFLDSKNAILREQLHPRLLEGKREPCEIKFDDFDDVSFKISCSAECPEIVKVSMFMYDMEKALRLGTQDVFNRLFPGMQTPPDDGFNYALEFNCDSIADPEKLLNDLSDLKRHALSGPLEKSFQSLLAESPSTSVTSINYRKNEIMFICPYQNKVVVVFLVDFADVTDKALSKVFLQQFEEAQRAVRSAPPISYSKEPPMELADVQFEYSNDIAGFLSFGLEKRHVQGERMQTAITLLLGFRNYLHYHIKCSKTYLHMRMRKRVAGWMQVLNRAVPEVETEKKTAAGKTFSRK